MIIKIETCNEELEDLGFSDSFELLTHLSELLENSDKEINFAIKVVSNE